MHKFFIFLLICLHITPIFADSFNSKLRMNQPKTIISTYKNNRMRNRYHHNHCPECHYNSSYLSEQNLSALEKHALNRTYKRENNLHRLERLENLVFGATQFGDIGNRYSNVENAILSRPQYKTKNRIIGNLANYLSGSPTGFTPNINNDVYIPDMGLPAGLGFTNYGGDFFPAPGFNNRRFEQYSNGIFGGGWGLSNSNFGTGSSIKIMD